MDFSIIVSIAALMLSTASFWYTKRQLEYNNYPTLTLEPKFRRINRRVENTYGEGFCIEEGSFIDIEITNHNDDISAIDVDLRVGISRRREMDFVFNFIYLFRHRRYYQLKFLQIKPKERVSPFKSKSAFSPIFLEKNLKFKTFFRYKSIIEKESYLGQSFDVLRDRRQQLRMHVCVTYKANRYKSQTLRCKTNFLMEARYLDEEDIPPCNHVIWDIQET